MSIGPVINKKQLAAHLARIAAAKAAGAKQIVGGEPQGQALPPHVFVDVRYEMKIAQEEAFGPIAPIIKVNGVEVPRFLKKNGVNMGTEAAIESYIQRILTSANEQNVR